MSNNKNTERGGQLCDWINTLIPDLQVGVADHMVTVIVHGDELGKFYLSVRQCRELAVKFTGLADIVETNKNLSVLRK